MIFSILLVSGRMTFEVPSIPSLIPFSSYVALVLLHHVQAFTYISLENVKHPPNPHNKECLALSHILMVDPNQNLIFKLFHPCDSVNGVDGRKVNLLRLIRDELLVSLPQSCQTQCLPHVRKHRLCYFQ